MKAPFPKFKFKNDAYTRRRGTPAMLMISCAGCNQLVMGYQKDGPGPLLRCYLDRIHYPTDLSSLQHQEFDKDAFPHLVCPSCQVVIGTVMIYEKENRPAYLMRKGFFKRKKVY